MIASFRHKGLKLVYETGSRRKLPLQLVNKIERVLAVSTSPPGRRTWTCRVSACIR
jgi:plasmid maintenance system killer protein